MPRHGLNSPDLPLPVGPFSHVVEAGAFFHVSGQVAQDPKSGKLIEGDVAAQTTRILENLQLVLKTVDRDLRHIVKTTVFLTDMADYAAMNAVYASQFEAPYPARSTIAVRALPLGARVEIECVAH